MTRVAILHAYFTILGGGEYLCLKMYEALNRRYSVTIYTVTPVDTARIKKLFNIDVSGFNIVVEPEFEAGLMGVMRGRLVRLRRLVSYHRFFTGMKDVLRGYDFVVDTQSNVPSPVDLAYIHYPAVAEAYKGGVGGLYDRLVGFLYRRWFGHPLSGRVVTNSRWTASVIYRYYGVYADVVYPPVPVRELKVLYSSSDRDNVVLTVSRFTPEKQLWKILYAAKLLPRYRFVIAGSTSPYSRPVIDKLYRVKEELGLQNVEIKPDMPWSELVKTMSVAKFYLHPPFPEHFGISVVQAMAAGLVPIVYRDGGTWYDIVGRVSPRLGYRFIGEIPLIIEYAEKNYEELRLRSHQVSLLFNEGFFQKNIMDYIGRLIEIKEIGVGK